MLSYELISITTYDNIVYPLADGASRFVLNTPGNLGLPPIDYLTQRTYKGDGVVETGYRLGQRDFTVNFRNQGCSRNDYWNIRQSLINILRPNRGGQATFTIRLSTGEKRALTVRSLSPTFPEVENTRWDEYSYTEILQFLAFDPVWYDPSEDSYEVVNDPADQLVFPITFDDANIIFGGDSYGIASITYDGSWYAYPVIVITAPFDQVTLSHIELGVSLSLIYGIASGYIEINLANQTITDQDGNSLWGYLTENSDLQGFKLEPDPVVSGGVNQINIFLPGSDGSTTVNVFWNTRYIGI